MAWQFPLPKTVTGANTVILDENGESVFVAREVYLAVEGPGYNTIPGTLSNHQIVIAGTVTNAGNDTISIGTSSAVEHSSVITVEETGQVRNFEAGAIRINGYDMGLVNHGLIESAGFAIVMNGQDATGASSIVNTGIIDAEKVAISQGGSGMTTETVTVFNTGMIKGGAERFRQQHPFRQGRHWLGNSPMRISW